MIFSHVNREGVASPPGHPWAWRGLGLAQLGHGMYDEAAHSLQQHIRLPTMAHAVYELPAAEEIGWQIWAALGEAYLKLGKHTAAVKALKRSHDMHPSAPATTTTGVPAGQVPADMVDITRMLAEAQLMMGLPREAIVSCQAVLDTVPDDLKATVVLAQAMLQRATEEGVTAYHYIDTAADLLRKAMPRCATVSLVPKLLGDALTLHHVACVTSSAKPVSNSDKASLYRNRIRLLKEGGRAYQKALHMRPTPQYWADLAVNIHYRSLPVMHCNGLERADGVTSVSLARRVAWSAVKSAPADWRNWNTLGNIESNEVLKQHCYVQAVQMEPRAQPAWTNMALLYLGSARARPESSREAFVAANTVDPTSDASWTTHGINMEQKAQRIETEGCDVDELEEVLQAAEHAYNHSLDDSKRLQPEAMLGGGRTALANVDPHAALLRSETLLAVHPLHGEALMVKGLALEQLYRLEEAKEALLGARSSLAAQKGSFATPPRYGRDGSVTTRQSLSGCLETALQRVDAQLGLHVPEVADGLGQWAPVVQALACGRSVQTSCELLLQSTTDHQARLRGLLALSRRSLASSSGLASDAIEVLHTCLRECPCPLALVALGICIVRHGDPSQARDLIPSLVRLHAECKSRIAPSESTGPGMESSDESSYMVGGAPAGQQGSLPTHRDHEDITSVLVSLLVKGGNLREARAVCAHAVHAFPASTHFRSLLVNSHLLRDEADSVEYGTLGGPTPMLRNVLPPSTCLDKTAGLDPDYLALAGMLGLWDGDGNQALRWCTHAHRLRPSSASYTALLAARARVALDDTTSAGRDKVEACLGLLLRAGSRVGIDTVSHVLTLLITGECQMAIGQNASETVGRARACAAGNDAPDHVLQMCIWMDGRAREALEPGSGRPLYKQVVASGAHVSPLQWAELSRSYVRTGHVDAAILCLDNALKLDSPAHFKEAARLQQAVACLSRFQAVQGTQDAAGQDASSTLSEALGVLKDVYGSNGNCYYSPVSLGLYTLAMSIGGRGKSAKKKLGDLDKVVGRLSETRTGARREQHVTLNELAERVRGLVF